LQKEDVALVTAWPDAWCFGAEVSHHEDAASGQIVIPGGPHIRDTHGEGEAHVATGDSLACALHLALDHDR